MNQMQVLDSGAPMGYESDTWSGYRCGVEKLEVLDSNGIIVGVHTRGAILWRLMWEYRGMTLRVNGVYTSPLYGGTTRTHTDYRIPAHPLAYAVVRYSDGGVDRLPVWDENTLAQFRRSGYEILSVENTGPINPKNFWYRKQ